MSLLEFHYEDWGGICRAEGGSDDGDVEVYPDVITIVPHGSQEIVLADNPLAVADHVLEEIKHLRLQGDQHPTASQLAPRRIEREIVKAVEQRITPPKGQNSTTTHALTTLTFRTFSVKEQGPVFGAKDRLSGTWWRSETVNWEARPSG